MIIKDEVYGEFEINGVLEELINTKEVQRLKKVHQAGASFLVNPKWDVTRFEHSVGTMIFVNLMGGSLEEQIAALLHDISHTAFSHVVDYALKNDKEDYHENIFMEVIEKSDIPKILNKYGYDYKNILEDESKWTILEQPAPALCGDRIDYTLRDMIHNDIITKEQVEKFLSSLEVKCGQVVINSVDNAEWFVDIYYKEVIDFFMNPLNAYADDRLSKILEIALDKGYISYDDLLKDDSYVLNIIKSIKDNEIIKLMNGLNYKIKAFEDEKNYEIHIVNKLRIIDPGIFVHGSIIKSSKKSKLIMDMNNEARKKALKGIYVRFEI